MNWLCYQAACSLAIPGTNPASNDPTFSDRADLGFSTHLCRSAVNLGHDRTSRVNMGGQAQEATGADTLVVLADRGYFSGQEVLACEGTGIVPICPKPLTSAAKADGRWGKQDFVYQVESDTYRCPAGETMTRRFSTVEQGMTLHAYATPACRYNCAVKANCTASIERRIKRWDHEEVIEAMQGRLDRMPSAMRTRRRTVEHVFVHHQGLDETKPFQDTYPEERWHRDEPSCPRL